MSVPEKKFVLTYVIDNISEIIVDQEYKKTEEHFSIPWQLDFGRKNGHLQMFLHCLRPAEIEKWSIQTEFKIKLISQHGNSLSRTTNFCFENSRRNAGYFEIITWDHLQRYYAVNQKVTLKIHVKIDKITGFGREDLRNFDESNEFSDVVLVVEQRKFNVLKQFLSFQSSYFKSLFFGKFEESKQSKIVLNNVDPEDFQCFLELIHGESPIDDSNIDGILYLADMYDSPTAIRRCEEFLLKESKWTVEEKLELSNRYNLANLKQNCLSVMDCR